MYTIDLFWGKISINFGMYQFVVRNNKKYVNVCNLGETSIDCLMTHVPLIFWSFYNLEMCKKRVKNNRKYCELGNLDWENLKFHFLLNFLNENIKEQEFPIIFFVLLYPILIYIPCVSLSWWDFLSTCFWKSNIKNLGQNIP